MESREEKESRGKILWKIFMSTLYLSAFTFGGGYVIVTLMKKKFVDEYHWIGEDEMLDLVAIAQSSPGAIAVNGAIVVGYKLAGIPGALVAILGTILPPFVIIAAISVCYNVFRSNFFVAQMLSGMQAGVGAVIASVTYDMGKSHRKGERSYVTCHYAGSLPGSLCSGDQCGLYRDRLWTDGCGPDTSFQKEVRKMIYLQLFLSFLQIGMFSFGGGYAAMPLIQGQVVTTSWMADHVGVYGSDHDITDDTGPYCSEFRYLRGTEDCRDSRSRGGNGRMYSAVLYYCDDPRKTIPEVS